MISLDVVYPSGFYAYQTPVVLDYVAALNGYAAPVPRGGSFTYVDLGCGDGFTIVLLAAMYPEARFVGVDLDPRHVARGRALAAAGEISNVELIEGDFSKWQELDLPRAHYVALHGVWAWISDAMRAAVVAYLKERLHGGGFVYLGYNAMPGWAGAAALRRFFLEWADEQDAIAGVRSSLKKLSQLKAQGAEFFLQNPVAGALLDEWQKKDIRYVAHEIFSPNWAPQAFAEVQRDLGGAGLEFAGSSDLAKNFLPISIKPAFHALIAAEKNRVRAELLRDYASGTRFRRDLFIKPGGRLDIAEFETRPFGMRVPVEDAATVVPLPTGRMNVAGEPFASIRRALATRTHSIDELAAVLRLPKQAVADAVQVLTLGWQVAPFARATEPGAAPRAWKIKHELNRFLLANPVEQEGFELLIAPATGSALALPRAAADLLRKKAEAPKWRLSKWAELGLIAPV